MTSKETKTSGYERVEHGGWSLIIAADQGSRTQPLPARGMLTIGRGESADIQIVDDSISRHHAILHVGERLEVEDSDSSNGTFVHGERIDPGRRIDLQPGDFFEVGSIVCAVLGARAGGARERQLRPHGYFEIRLQDAVDHARAHGTSLGVIRIRVEDDRDEVVDTLLASVRPGDVVAQYAPHEFELLLIGDDAASVAATAKRLRDRWGADVGYASYPADACSAGELFAVACEAMRPDDEPDLAPGEAIVADPKMRQLHGLLSRVARGGVNVLLLGETGVGKEIFAERLHRESARADRPSIRLNCAAFSAPLLESELFGHEKGAFTGADTRKVGLLENADGGIVFLDEVGDLDLTIQAKLLRVIEAGTLRRIGGFEEIAIDVVYVAATNRDLTRDIAAGRFRSDLFFRLNGFSVTIPPLRERPSEILLMAMAFARTAAERLGDASSPRLTEAARDRLMSHHWPGNVRELRNAMERAVLLSGGDPIDAVHLTLQELPGAPGLDAVGRTISVLAGDAAAPPDLTAEQLEERKRIIHALAASRGNQTRAAQMLGMSRRWLSTMMTRYQIPRAREC